MDFNNFLNLLNIPYIPHAIMNSTLEVYEHAYQLSNENENAIP